ncbi:MAG: toll/interleukin-1 receptor domain-containing protein [Candidatus Omnitrophota bacterium]|nr:toll/interleukin-1 receptor domain-containing protein [Candidatus Omnitrophota bacterium]
MALNLKQLLKGVKEYVETEAHTKVKSVSYVGRFQLLGKEDIVFSVVITDKKEPEWWVVGGSTPMNLYSKIHFHSADEAFSMHTGLMLRMAAHDFKHSTTVPEDIGYDAFISHASEDKTGLVRPLANVLKRMGYRIWYDEFELQVGDSLRQSIDRGLVNSRYGIVVLSNAFFAKNWPQYELNGLTAKEMRGHKVILPIWHKITKDDILKFSPALADKVAITTRGHSIKEVATKLAKVFEN